MNTFIKNALVAAALSFSTMAAAQITFYEGESFQGRSFTAQGLVENFRSAGFNDRASSLVVVGDRWEVCEDAAFSGRCVVLRSGNYPSLRAIGLDNRISSVRYVNWNTGASGYQPAPVTADYRDNRDYRDYRRRSGERLYEANVTSVRAVVGAAEQRCWVEQQAVPQQRSNTNVPGAIVGAIVGGIIGHQFGNGTGQDIATVGGAAAGGYVGSNVGRGYSGQQVQNVQRCENVSNQATPTYWDVTYNFRGQEHRVQMTNQPGPTVTVNEQGEPRA
ncbi:MAG: beta/gamma crystallin-related protein [Betaproteobacteria bacterium]